MTALMTDPAIVFGIGCVVLAAAGAAWKWLLAPSLRADLTKPVDDLKLELTQEIRNTHSESTRAYLDLSERQTNYEKTMNEQLADVRRKQA